MKFMITVKSRVDTGLVFDIDIGKSRFLGDEVKENQDGNMLCSDCQILGGQSPSVKILWDILQHCISSFTKFLCVIFS